MRTFILIAAALLIQQQAFAGFSGQCHDRVDLVCEASLNQANGSSKLVS
jgi:hypothetical protein